MSKLTAIVYVMAAPTLMGVFVLLALLIPPFSANLAKYIPLAALVGVVVGLPVSVMISRAINSLTKGQ